MRRTVLAALITAAVCCVRNPKPTAPQKFPEDLHLVVQVPKENFAHLTGNYQFMVKGFAEDGIPTGSFEVVLAYCLLDEDGDGFTCLVTVHQPYVRLELQAMYQGPWPESLPPDELAAYTERWKADKAFRNAESDKRSPPELCGQIRVGVSISSYEFRGWRPTAQKWFDLTPQTDPHCFYQLPPNAFEGLVPPGPNVFQVFTE